MKTVFKLNFLLFVLSLPIMANAQELLSGSVIGRHIYGLATDYQGDPVIINDRPLIYKNSQFSKSLNIDKSRFIVSGFNDAIGAVYITELDEESNNAVDTVALDLESVDGLYHPVGGVHTDWNSVLFSESQSINAVQPQTFIDEFKPFYKGKTSLINPYHYGWVSEVVVLDASGQAKAIKSYAVGRLFANQIIVMPDGKTLYLLDQAGNLYLFVAEAANSLAKGELYAISRQQGKITYTELGKNNALKVKFKLKNLTFDSIFKSDTPKNQRCKKSFTYISTVYGEECLKLNPKNKKYAGFFEPQRVLALQDISTLVSANSRMVFNAKDKQLRFSQTDNSEISLSLGENSQFNSQFIVKEPL